MKYTELKRRQREELNKFPVEFAFNQKQLTDGLEKLGITTSEAVSLPGGGFIRKKDRDAFFEMFKRHESERELALQNDEFMLEAIEYELGNHEFCITRDPEPALAAVGVELSDERVKKLYQVARKRYWQGIEELNNRVDD